MLSSACAYLFIVRLPLGDLRWHVEERAGLGSQMVRLELGSQPGLPAPAQAGRGGCWSTLPTFSKLRHLCICRKVQRRVIHSCL